MVANAKLALALVAALLTGAIARGAGDDRATELLRRSMGRKFPVNVVAVILQRDPGSDGTYQRVKVVRAKDGRVRHTILQPLRMCGIDSVDDGDKMAVYLPDKQSMIIQDSSQQSEPDVNERLSLAKQNYTFTVSVGPRIAGRTTVSVVANPRAPEMATRRYSLDEKTGYPLRLQVDEEQPRARTIFDTIAIEFPTRLPEPVFEMDPLPGTKTIRYQRPKTLNSRAHAEREVGFRPILPERYPMGFKLQEMQVNQGDEWKSVVVRLSDGLVRATVYQWKPEGQPVESVEESTTIEVNGIRLLLVSDLPAGIRTKLLNAFISRSQQTEAPQALRIVGVRDRNPLFELELRYLLRAFAPLESTFAMG